MKTLKEWYTELFPYINKAESVGTRNKDLLRWLDITDHKLGKKQIPKPKGNNAKLSS